MPGFPLPAPIGLDPSGAKLSVDLKESFDTGVPANDRAAAIHLVMADVDYDQIFDVSIDTDVTETDNDISAPHALSLVPVWKTQHDPASVYIVAFLLTVEFGYAALYFTNGVTTDVPDVTSVLPVPLVPGGWIFHMNDNDYELASNWHGLPDVPIYVQEIYAATFLPTRITGRVWLKNKGV
jgi:hypothetical protein